MESHSNSEPSDSVQNRQNSSGSGASSSEQREALASLAGLNKNSKQLPKNFLEETGFGDCVIQVPATLTIEHSLNEILCFARQFQASDVHISVNKPIIFRKFGTLSPETKESYSADGIQTLISTAIDPAQLAIFKQTGDNEFVHTISGGGRYRVTLMKQRLGWDFTARVIPTKILSLEETGMPASCEGLTKWAQGLVLITGPAGCGKTSSLSTLLELINESRDEHIITIEDPIEIVYTPQKCQITQRQIERHTLSQASALRAALREDPDILVVSELRDLESIQLAVTAAETGHLVFGTMNTNTASQTITSLINSFPPEEQTIITNMISESLRGVICQQLIPKKDASGVVPAYEVLILKTSVANMIRAGNLAQINNVIATGKSAGMVLFDNSLAELVQSGVVDYEEAEARAADPKILRQHTQRAPAGIPPVDFDSFNVFQDDPLKG